MVVGAAGMLGQDLVALLAGRGHQVDGLDRPHIDITDPAQTVGLAGGYDVLVNVAAFTAVDPAETNEAAAFAVNAAGAANLAASARDAGARIVHISTDYVFDGVADGPYAEDAPIAPRSAYGRTKAAGEWAVRATTPDHLVVRTAWLYGAHGACFPKTIARVASANGHVDVVADQVGQPTWTRDLSDLIERLVAARVPAGVYHGTSGGQASWYEFARAVVEAAGQDPRIVAPTTTEASARPAPRPAWSVLGHDALMRAGVRPIRDWAEAWQAAAAEVLAG